MAKNRPSMVNLESFGPPPLIKDFFLKKMFFDALPKCISGWSATGRSFRFEERLANGDVRGQNTIMLIILFVLACLFAFRQVQSIFTFCQIIYDGFEWLGNI